MGNDEIKSRSTRMKSWDQAIECFGVGYIFEKKAAALRRVLRLLTFLGIAVPLAVGGIVLAVGTSSQYLNIVLGAAGLLGVSQLVMSAWSLTARWQERYAYAKESMTANYRFSKRFKSLGESPPDDLDLQYKLLDPEVSARRDGDIKEGINDKEKRMGMRAGLRNFERACAGCDKVPKSLKASKCDVCGNF